MVFHRVFDGFLLAFSGDFLFSASLFGTFGGIFFYFFLGASKHLPRKSYVVGVFLGV